MPKNSLKIFLHLSPQDEYLFEKCNLCCTDANLFFYSGDGCQQNFSGTYKIGTIAFYCPCDNGYFCLDVSMSLKFTDNQEFIIHL